MAAGLKKATWAALAREQRKPVQCVMLELPAPISTNELWAHGRGHVHLSKSYRSWLRDAGIILNSQHPGIVTGPYALTLKVSAAWGGDLDNAIKGTSDLLQHHGVIENDRLAQRILIERADIHGLSVLVASTREAHQ